MSKTPIQIETETRLNYNAVISVTNSNTNIYDSNSIFTMNFINNFENLTAVLSPFAISLLLSVVHAGSSGKTSNQITKFLHYRYDVDMINQLLISLNSNCTLFINAVFINHKYYPKKIFRNLINKKNKIFIIKKDQYLDNLIKINKYIYSQSKYFNNQIHIQKLKIKKILKATKSISLLNISMFNTIWEYPFDSAKTFTSKFYKTEPIMLMHQINWFNVYEDDNIQLIELPFKDSRSVFGVILPKKYLNEENLNYNIDNIPMLSISETAEYINNTEYKLVELYLPKFQIDNFYLLNDSLKKMGVTKIFKKSAELEVINTGAYVNTIYHYIHINIDETGFYEPSHKTKTDKEYVSDGSNVIFRADHPFIYYVRHVESGLFLLHGNFLG